jgi:hypothetical protein
VSFLTASQEKHDSARLCARSCAAEVTMPTSNAGATDFEVRRDDLRKSRFAHGPAPDAAHLAPGQVAVRIDRFALTANNVTYGVAGDALGYWKFFPAEPGWGRIPVWGFGDVIASRHDALPAGERLYGYFPMSTHLVLQPERVSAQALIDGAAHRRELPAAYNGYNRTAADPLYQAAHEDLLMLLRPLFTTSFLLDDFLEDNGFFGARTVLLASASSKTALGLAHLLSRRAPACRVVGLTSARNRVFVEGLGCYARTVLYDAIAELPPDEPTVFVDMAGDGGVAAAVHRHFGDRLRHSCTVGVTHWEQRGQPAELPGPRPTFFFAPSRVQKRAADWGAAGLQERIKAAWVDFVGPVSGWIRIVRGAGEKAVEQVYRDTLEGRARPDQGHVLSLHPA